MTNKNKFLLIFGLISLLISTNILTLSLNKDRVIFHEPDDHFSYLVNSSNFKHCKLSKCYFENFYKFSTKESEGTNDLNYDFERQIHRVILDYTTLYTFILEKTSNLNNLFKAQEIFHLILGIISALVIFNYLKISLDPKLVFLISIIVSFHYFSNGWGIQKPIAWTFSTFIGSLAVLYQFKSKYLSLVFYSISALFHEIGLVILVMGLCVYIFENKQKLINSKFIHFKKDIIFILSVIAILIFSYTIKYSIINDDKLNSFNIYSIDLTLDNIVYKIKMNFLKFTKFFTETFILLNPILLFFFIFSFFVKLTKEIRCIKIFTIIYFIFSFLLIHAVSDFAIGERVWQIFIINYLILSISTMYYLSEKNYILKIIKNLFLISLPFFLILNVSKYMHVLPGAIERENNYYNESNISKIRENINSSDLVYFDTRESTFYYFLINGFIKNNIFFKTSNLSDIENVKFLVLDNPIKIKRSNSDLLIKNNSIINMDKKLNTYDLILFSKENLNIEINQKNYDLNEGINIIEFKSKTLKFNKVDQNLRLIGLKLETSQEFNWPWGQDIEFELIENLKNYHRYLFLKQYNYKRKTKINFKDINFGINNIFDECDKTLISDSDSSILYSMNCKIL